MKFSIKNIVLLIVLQFLFIIKIDAQSPCYSFLITKTASNSYTWNLNISNYTSGSISATIQLSRNGSGLFNASNTEILFGPFAENGNSFSGTFTYSGADFDWNQNFQGVTINLFTSLSLCPLPITLTTFSATQHSERTSKLDWKTSSEINSAYFGIERSRDGDTWETIGKVAAAGNSHTELTYEYIDDNLPFSRTVDQIYYYRLRLTDQDGSHKYSDIKAVNFSRKTSDGIAIYPNPSTQMVHLDISTMDASAGEIDLRIYDIHGRIMVDKQIIGAGIEPIDVTQYPTGTYQVSVTQGTTQHQKRFIKIE